MTHAVNIEGINIYAYHGCLEEEKQKGGNYTVDVYMTTDFSEALASDELEDTLDYCVVYDICKSEMAIRSKLIEHVCQRIHFKLRNTFPALKTLKVKVSKFTLPAINDVDKVSVEIAD
jgi:7,8-dihydroneopterin aldolase/epimerase/oxygenase